MGPTKSRRVCACNEGDGRGPAAASEFCSFWVGDVDPGETWWQAEGEGVKTKLGRSPSLVLIHIDKLQVDLAAIYRGSAGMRKK